MSTSRNANGLALFVAGLCFYACNTADFGGGNSKATPKKDEATATSPGTGTKTAAPTPPTDQKTVYVPVGGTKDVGVPGACTPSDKTIATCNNGKVTGNKVGTTVVNSPAAPGGVGSGGGTTTKVVVYDPKNPPPGLGSTVDGAGAVAPTSQVDGVTPAQTSDDTIVFQGNKRFHVGDGAFTQSSCNLELKDLTTAGVQYYFQFQVLQDGTDVTATLGEVCGVDYKFSNVLQILDAQNQQVVSQTLPPNVGDLAVSVPITAPNLAAGTYQIVITSNNCDQQKEGTDPATGQPFCTPPGAGQTATDRDDFIVGNVKAVGTKPIRPGSSGVQQSAP